MAPASVSLGSASLASMSITVAGRPGSGGGRGRQRGRDRPAGVARQPDPFAEHLRRGRDRRRSGRRAREEARQGDQPGAEHEREDRRRARRAVAQQHHEPAERQHGADDDRGGGERDARECASFRHGSRGLLPGAILRLPATPAKRGFHGASTRPNRAALRPATLAGAGRAIPLRGPGAVHMLARKRLRPTGISWKSSVWA